MWNLIVLGITILFFALLFIFPFPFLHPKIAYHVWIKKHTIDTVPVGFADWDIHCSCGLKAEL